MSTKPRFRVQAGDRHGLSARAVVRRPVSSYYAGDLASQATAGWYPRLSSANSAWLPERDISIARIRDMARNEGWVQSAIDRQTDMIVGGTFRLSAKPDARRLGISEEAAREFAHEIESRWRDFAEDPTFRCDAQRRLNFPAQMGLACRHYVRDGEAVGILRWIERYNWPYNTCVQIVDPDRLGTPPGESMNERIHGGVEVDADGAPIAYHFRRRHPGDIGASADAFHWDRVERWDDVYGWERPKVLHAYEMMQADQARGVSKLVAALVKTRLLSRYSEAEVKAAALNGSVVGVIYSELGSAFTEEALAGPAGGMRRGIDWAGLTSARSDFYSDRTVLDDARFMTAFPSDKVEMNVNPRNTVGFPAFQTAFLQNFAASIGLSYEQLSMDWSKTNYSSARAALNEVWRAISRMRGVMIAGFAQPIYTAWLEDALDTGEIATPAGAPDFYDAPAAYVRSEWIGPARGYVDPVKEIQGAKMRIDARLSTYEREAAEQGHDIALMHPQLEREIADMAARGILPDMLGHNGGPALDDEESDDRDRRERMESGAA